MGQVTVRDVAKRAGVSISTVSRVLTGSAPVSKELYERVVAAIEELGYRPNALARGLRARRTAILGLIVPDISNPFFGQLAKVVEQQAHAHGYSIVLCNSQNSRERELQYLDLLSRQRVDGLMVVAAGVSRADLEGFTVATGAPVLALDRRIPDFGGPFVGADPYPGAVEAVGHLLALGHRRIGILRGKTGSASADERFEALLRACRAHGLTEAPWIWSGEYSLETGIEAGNAWAALPADQRPTAIIAASEFSAYGLIQSVFSHGLSVPDDLSVVGFDNTPFAQLLRPALTVIGQPIERMGELAVETMLRLLARAEEETLPAVAPLPGRVAWERRREPVQDQVLPTELVVRSSTGPAPAAR